MSVMKSCMDCGKCFQRGNSADANWKSVLCLLTRSPFRLRLLLLERLTGHCADRQRCRQLIWRG